MPSAKPHVFHPDVAFRLALLNLTVEDVHGALEAGMHRRANVGETAPRNHRGVVMWGAVVERFREGLKGQGWTLDDRNNLPRIVNPNNTISISVLTGTETTGEGVGMTIDLPRGRGPESRRTIDNGLHTPDFFDAEWEEAAKELQQASARGVDGPAAWWLVFFVDGKRVRAEVSRPLRFVKGDRGAECSERVFVPPFTFAPAENLEEPQGDTVDVPVARRQ